jgi:hypothetical protein
VPQKVFGKVWLPCYLVVDRYGGFNHVPCTIQCCYGHLSREVQDLEQEFLESTQVRRLSVSRRRNSPGDGAANPADLGA